MMKIKGFTLVELLIVVVIIGVLASLVIPRFSGQTERAKAAEAINIMSAIRRVALAYNDEHKGQIPEWPVIGSSATPGTVAEFRDILGMIFKPPLYWGFFTGVQGSDCLITAKNKVTAADTLTLLAGTGEWCGTGNYAPSGKYWPNLTPVRSGC